MACCETALDGGITNWAGGEVRGDRGYVVLWDGGQAALDAARAVPETTQKPPNLSLLPSRSKVGVEGAKAVRVAPEGERNTTLNREAFLAERRGDLDEAEMREAALEAGLTEREVAATIASAKQAGHAARGPKLDEVEGAVGSAGAEEAPRLVAAPSSPVAVARALAATVFTSGGGALTLRHH